MKDWTIENAKKRYSIKHWGNPYFDINAKGHVTVKPDKKSDHEIDLFQATQMVRDSGLELPVLLRFTDILKSRAAELCDAFSNSTDQHGYKGSYSAVYPIKVNQQRTVVEHLVQNSRNNVGLEAGSKPELMIVLSQAQSNSPIICNGYKDREYIRLALMGQKMGHKVFIVIEKLSELDHILSESEKMEVTPNLGIRLRLSSIGKGNWQNTGGEKSKFGLSAAQALLIVDKLKETNSTNCLSLMHCHIGSQLANIRDIQNGLQEIVRYYVELRHLDVPISHIDVGGGLGIDYEGSRSRNYCSMNYSIEEYANVIIQTFKQTCADQDLPHPNIITESGRALTAHHAVLISNIIDNESHNSDKLISAPKENDPSILSNFWRSYENISSRSVVEAYHDASHWLSEAQSMFTHGLLSLQQRAYAEQLYYQTCEKIRVLLSMDQRTHREIMDEINEKLAEKYFCNLSIFQSLPDIWAIDQVFPIMPIHRLNEEPTKRVTIQDLTCDSDGTIENYVESENIETTLAAHNLNANEPYLLGFFLVGAYQEILGDMHNLFGDTHSVDVSVNEDGRTLLTEAETGDTVEELLNFIHYNSDRLLDIYQGKLNKTQLSQLEKESYFIELKSGMKGYSYLTE